MDQGFFTRTVLYAGPGRAGQVVSECPTDSEVLQFQVFSSTLSSVVHGPLFSGLLRHYGLREAVLPALSLSPTSCVILGVSFFRLVLTPTFEGQSHRTLWAIL